jgi:hypothetical protein
MVGLDPGGPETRPFRFPATGLPGVSNVQQIPASREGVSRKSQCYFQNTLFPVLYAKSVQQTWVREPMQAIEL